MKVKERWFLLISLMFSAKKGLSAMQSARCLELRRPTVWSMMHRIREAINTQAKNDLIKIGLTSEQAIMVITAIAKNEISNVKIIY